MILYFIIHPFVTLLVVFCDLELVFYYSWHYIRFNQNKDTFKVFLSEQKPYK